MVRELVKSADPKMVRALEHFESDLGSLRTGRANTALVDTIMVEVYGTMQPIKAVGSVTTPDARTIAITVWDRSTVGNVEKALRDTQSLGLNPMSDGNVIRLNVPPMTEERRREIVKSLGTKVEDCRVALRNIRHEILGEVKRAEKAGELTQDDAKFAETELNKKIEQFQKQIETIESGKAREIMEV